MNHSRKFAFEFVDKPISLQIYHKQSFIERW